MAVDTLTLQEIQARVNTVIRDPSKVFVTDENVKDWVNEAQLELAARFRSFIAESTGTVGVDGDVDLPADFLEVRRLHLGTVVPFDRVEMVTDDVFNDQVDNTTTPSHSVGRIAPGNLAIEIYPVPGSGVAFTLRYYQAPDDLAASGDISLLPAILHTKLVRYAQAQACIKIREFDQAAAYEGLYQEGLPPPPGAVRPTQSAPRTMHYQRGPFDTAEARHI